MHTHVLHIIFYDRKKLSKKQSLPFLKKSSTPKYSSIPTDCRFFFPQEVLFLLEGSQVKVSVLIFCHVLSTKEQISSVSHTFDAIISIC